MAADHQEIAFDICICEQGGRRHLDDAVGSSDISRDAHTPKGDRIAGRHGRHHTVYER